MTLVKGPVMELFWTQGRSNQYTETKGVVKNYKDPIKGSLMIVTGCFSWSCFMILQVSSFRFLFPHRELTYYIYM